MCGREDRALQECNLSARPSVDCGSILPGIALHAGILLSGCRATTVKAIKLNSHMTIHILGSGAQTSVVAWV
jgi:hypothetical protein